MRFKLSRSGVCLRIALWIVVSAGVAKADTVQANLFSAVAANGATVVNIAVQGVTAPSNAPLTGAGMTINFSVNSGQGIVTGPSSGAYAVPVAGAIGSTPEYLTGNFGSTLTSNIADSGNYLSTGIGSITVTFTTPQYSLAMLWGSIDDFNSVTLSDGTTITGTEVQAAAHGFVSNGFQGPGGSSYVIIDSPGGFTSVTFSSTSPSFEFAGIAGSNEDFTFTTPEPSSLALSGIGIGIMGLFALLRRRTTRATTQREG